MEGIGKILLAIGIVISVIGFGLIFVQKIPFIGEHIGRLPGDIYIKKENTTFYFPFTTCLIISLIISIVLYFFKK